MKPVNGSSGTESSPDNPATETQFFFPEWVTSVFYGGRWYEVKAGTFKEGIGTDEGPMAVYIDPFDDATIFIMAPITGYRVKKPEQAPPFEPEASVTQLHKQPW